MTLNKPGATTGKYCNSLHLSVKVKDAMDIVKLLILIAKLCKCIRFFKSGDQIVVRSNVTGGDGITDNQMGIEFQNTDDNFIVASVDGSISAGNGVHAKSTPYYITT